MKFSVSRCKLVTITIEKSTVNNELNKINKKSIFSKCSKFHLDFKNAEKKWANFFYSLKIASELLALNCPN